MRNATHRICLFLCLQMTLSYTIHAKQVAQCLGPLVIDDSPVSAKVYSEGKIIIETEFDIIESEAKVNSLPGGVVEVSDNDFGIFFTVSAISSAFPVQALRNGMFFVDDFYCISVN